MNINNVEKLVELIGKTLDKEVRDLLVQGLERELMAEPVQPRTVLTPGTTLSPTWSTKAVPCGAGH